MPLANLLPWFDAHKRDLPWRRTSDPYAVWVSEIMLQQTQVATVIPYYVRWMERFPTVDALAEAGEDDVLHAWQGLGYYRRCRMLLQGARYVAEHGMPQSPDGWLKVPGVGRYTAGAIASIAQGTSTPIVDGNVERVYARICASRAKGPALHKEAWEWAGQSVSQARPGDWNQALMELGATICKPVEPLCEQCPIAGECQANLLGLQNELPLKEERRKPVGLRHAVFVPYHQDRFGMRQIPSGQWWEGMWEFPRFDLTTGGEPPPPYAEAWSEAIGIVNHAVTHHRIRIDAALIRDAVQDQALRWVDVDEMSRLAIPAPQRRVLALAQKHLGLNRSRGT